MANDLDIRISTILEADEDKSASRILAQLPSIQSKINSQSKIKVCMEVDDSTFRTQAQKISKQYKNALNVEVGMDVTVPSDIKKQIEQSLSGFNVNSNVAKAVTDEMTQLGVRVNSVSSAWRECVDNENRMLSMTIQGTDQMGRALTIVKQFTYVTGDLEGQLEQQSSTVTKITSDFQKQREEQSKAQSVYEANVRWLEKEQAAADALKSTYSGAGSAKPVTDTTNLNNLETKYQTISDKIQALKSSSSTWTTSSKTEIEKLIAELKQLTKEYQNAEYVATSLRTKSISDIKVDQSDSLDKFESQLRSANLLTDEFQAEIADLRTSLAAVGGTDGAAMTNWLNSFDKLQSKATTLQEQLRQVKSIYSELNKVDSKILNVESSLTTETNSDVRSNLQAELTILQEQKAALEARLVPYQQIVGYAQLEAEYQQNVTMRTNELSNTEAQFAEKVREVEAVMQTIPTTVESLSAKFKQIDNPTESLKSNLESAKKLLNEYNSEMESGMITDTEKVEKYERLQELISLCSKEMSALSKAQSGDLASTRFIENLEKAKADLETVERQWSALKSDSGLNAQLQALKANLENVNTPAELKKWTASFSTFKSEVKAAGLNMQSLGDILKNNLSKVSQWASATTIIYKAFDALKSGINTVVELDTAMIELRKTTDATAAQYQEFYETANDTAKELGTTTEEIISQTAEWSRLGYELEDAEELAKNSAIFSSISEDLDVEDATDGLVSVLKAFGDEIDIDDSMDGIISKVNAVGKLIA